MCSQDNQEDGIHGIAAVDDSSRSLDNFVDRTRLERIASLKKALGENTYSVSAASLADKIIDHMLQL